MTDETKEQIKNEVKEQVYLQVQSAITPIAEMLNEIRHDTKEDRKNLHEHLQIYANNGKELKENNEVVKKTLSAISSIEKRIDNYHTEARSIAEDMKKEMLDIKAAVAPGVELINNVQGASRLFDWIVKNTRAIALILAVIGVSVWIALKAIFKEL